MLVNMLVDRILPNTDLKGEINNIQIKNNLKAGFIVCAVGSLQKAVLRMSNANIKKINGPLEILCASGSVSADGIHIHLALADKNGNVVGGHLKTGCKVYTTVEIGILEYKGTFRRIFDPKTGYKELVILR